MNPRRWFLPETPDVLGLLRRQLGLTIEGADALVRWADGEEVALTEMREIQTRGDLAKRDLLNALRVAFITPLEPEDLFTISRGSGRILGEMTGLVGEAAVLKCTPDRGIADMTALLAGCVTSIDTAVSKLGSSGTLASVDADRAIDAVRHMHDHYYRGMATTLELEDRGERIARREIYRRCSRIGDIAVEVAERVVYSVVKQS